MVVRLMQSGCL